MLPLRDDIPARRYPLVTSVLITVNVVAFLYELSLGERLNEVLLLWGLVPVRYTNPGVAQHFSLFEQLYPFLTSMFLHGGWLHLFANMWILWIFGDNVEDRLGHGRYLGLYLLGGLAAGLVHIYTNAGSALPTIGASGAVAGIMGAYFRFFPHARVETVVPPFFFGPIFEVPAVLFLGVWFLLQFFTGALTLLGRSGDFSGVAWWAHVGGFVFGLIMALFARRTAPERRRARFGAEDEEEGYF